MAKITGKEGEMFKGKAAVFDCEEDMSAAIGRKEIKEGMVCACMRARICLSVCVLSECIRACVCSCANACI